MRRMEERRGGRRRGREIRGGTGEEGEGWK